MSHGILHQACPPWLIDTVGGLRTFGWRTYPTHAAAAGGEGNGYASPAVAEFVVSRARRLFEDPSFDATSTLGSSAVLSLLLLGCVRRRPLHVIDFGGGTGLHGLAARGLLGDPESIRWSVVETPDMVQMLSALRLPGVAFFSSVEAAREAVGEVHVVFCSGTIHYLSNGLDWLGRFAELGPEAICLSRVPLAGSGRTRFLRQNARLCDHGLGPLPHPVPKVRVPHAMALFPRGQVLNAVPRPYHLAIDLADPVERVVFLGRAYPFHHLFFRRAEAYKVSNVSAS